MSRGPLRSSKWFQLLTHRYTRRALRVGRTVALGGAVYGIGYAGGIQQSLNDPEGTKRQVLEQVLTGQGGGPTTLLPDDSKETQYVKRLGGEIIVAAQGLIGDMVEQRADDVRRRADAVRVQPSAEPQDEELVRLIAKQGALHRNWQFVVIDDETVNAFVTDMLPGYVFVHRGLLTLLKGEPEQLSFILGHELSHYLLEHGGKDRQLQLGLSMLQLVVLAAVDPTGVLSLAAEVGAFSSLFSYGVMACSRSHESEADALGLELCTRACRDPGEAIKAHEALARYETAHGGDPAHAGLGASHPATAKRLRDLRLLLPQHARAYGEAGCAMRRQQLSRSFADLRSDMGLRERLGLRAARRDGTHE